jgi:hypothetical protein
VATADPLFLPFRAEAVFWASISSAGIGMTTSAQALPVGNAFRSDKH